ncbi:hypothetical protein [Candidatus Marithrix sp. Canyon 246]|uniref:hypothetical protein n=1 Tax=Candidatus Marithrix sp. Canyon 246 TaxID=1827136 RepID=UPI001495F9FF|nr:hypothetical protein [Candidatus Marithrix sp. Canyon 246]
MDKKLESTFELINENKCLEVISDNEFEIYDSNDKQRCFILLKNYNFSIITKITAKMI